MPEIEYITDQNGNTKAVVIPIELWQQIVPQEATVDELSEAVEDFCLNKAMDEAEETPLVNRETALKFLEE